MKEVLFMNKFLKKSIALLLALACALNLAIVSFAAESVTSGTCGKDLVWSFDEATGTLTISGVGAMDDFGDENPIPWENLQSEIKTVIITDGVTTIGDLAFSNCDNLTNVEIPDSVEYIGGAIFYLADYYEDTTNWGDDALYIGKYLIAANSFIIGDYVIKEGTVCIAEGAFQGCRSLTNITIPDSVNTIGSAAFHFCYELTNISIPDGVTSIKAGTFTMCKNLESVTIPDSVKSIEPIAFTACDKLNDIYFNGTESEWESIEISETGNEILNDVMVHYTEEANSSDNENPTLWDKVVDFFEDVANFFENVFNWLKNLFNKISLN